MATAAEDGCCGGGARQRQSEVEAKMAMLGDGGGGDAAQRMDGDPKLKLASYPAHANGLLRRGGDGGRSGGGGSGDLASSAKLVAEAASRCSRTASHRDLEKVDKACVAGGTGEGRRGAVARRSSTGGGTTRRSGAGEEAARRSSTGGGAARRGSAKERRQRRGDDDVDTGQRDDDAAGMLLRALECAERERGGSTRGSHGWQAGFDWPNLASQGAGLASWIAWPSK
uniref:Uncharacterized protein n=1 Tax=Oryza glumipatula TaxID=40148 RepID=A0A0E0AQB1_9ORYZ